MSFLMTKTEAMTSAAAALQAIGSAVSAQDAASAGPTTGVVPPAADTVSAVMAAHFAKHATDFQAVAAHAAEVREQFVKTLQTSAVSYLTTEAANAAAAG